MNHINEITHIESVRLSYDGKSVVIIDQTQLPNRTEYLTLSTAQDIWDAIYHLERRPSVSVQDMGSTALHFRSKLRIMLVSCVNSGRKRSIWIPPDRQP